MNTIVIGGRHMRIDEQICEHELALLSHEEFVNLSREQYSAFLKLKAVVGKDHWLLLDEYVTAKNTEFEFSMRYFYMKGLDDGGGSC